MGTTPLIDRINARKPREEPLPIADRMPPFARRQLQKRLPVKELTFYADGCGPDGRAA